MSRNVLEIRQSVHGARDSFTIVLDAQINLAVLAAARDDNGLCTSVNAVLDELRNCLQRVRLRKCDDADRVPVVTDPQFAPLCFFRTGCARLCHDSIHGLEGRLVPLVPLRSYIITVQRLTVVRPIDLAALGRGTSSSATAAGC